MEKRDLVFFLSMYWTGLEICLSVISKNEARYGKSGSRVLVVVFT